MTGLNDLPDALHALRTQSLFVMKVDVGEIHAAG